MLIPLKKKVEDELLKMQVLGVISKVDQPTDWCSGMVIVPKSKGCVRICVDLSKLNESVKRERLLLPSVEHTLAQLQGASVFSKLDANSGFWQVPLSKESALLTTFKMPFGRFCYNRLPFGITWHRSYFKSTKFRKHLTFVNFVSDLRFTKVKCLLIFVALGF